MLSSFTAHHSFPIHVYTTDSEAAKLKQTQGVRCLRAPSSPISALYKNSYKRVLEGYKRGHLGTARLWSNVIQSRNEDILIHVDADTVFLADCITPLLEELSRGAEMVGTRRPYLLRTYRKEGRDGRMLDKHPDALNTDLIAFRRKAIPKRFGPFLTRKIQGKRPVLYPVIDFFDPVVFDMIRKGRNLRYVDSPESGSQSTPNFESPLFQNRISFAAVGSGCNFYKNPQVSTSPGYRDYALASFALFSKHLLGVDIGIKPLNNPDLINKLERLDKSKWRLQ